MHLHLMLLDYVDGVPTGTIGTYLQSLLQSGIDTPWKEMFATVLAVHTYVGLVLVSGEKILFHCVREYVSFVCIMCHSVATVHTKLLHARLSRHNWLVCLFILNLA